MESSRTDVADLAIRLERIEATEAIRRVVHEFSHGFDRRELDRLLAVWHPEAVWLVAPGHEGVGHEGIRAVALASWDQMATTHHWNCNEVFDVDVDAGRGTGLVNVIALVRTREGEWHQSAATYHDTYVRVDGAWVIEGRNAEIHATLDLGRAPANHPWGDIAAADANGQ
ncbi:SnoaL-like domain-containing protein [Nocardia nova SH22a]|uniref:SnoaL-like domain-containing protein n=1 Tax=Nocardia nova SH22a TaxID=1415166 RepID=W5TGU9_9NOCA|nr:nuclear transport factor 2 family protein [Nocardia nova]AHH18595.1 SnoaL-like domain-containing protein [Nocardia nova SH22a]